MSASQSQIRTVVSALKKIIKKKGLTYKDVALKLKLSEQTIKRFFTDDDVSLSRLADICELVDVPLDELFSAALKQKTPAYRLTVAQEEFLVEHPGLFGLYSKQGVHALSNPLQRRRAGHVEIWKKIGVACSRNRIPQADIIRPLCHVRLVAFVCDAAMVS